MRMITKSHEQFLINFQRISEYEQKHDYKIIADQGLETVFLLSQNFPLENISDFLSGENISLSESYEELEISYELIKMGLYKQSMISLRTAFEIGLFSIYWSIIGSDSIEFKKWLSSHSDTPYKDKKFWNKLKSNKNIDEYDKHFNLIDEIRKMDLSDFVHTKGIMFSNRGEFQRKINGQSEVENFKEWISSFKKIVNSLVVLHLLRFPALNLKYSTDFLLSKFGTYENIPQFGAGLGDEMLVIQNFISEAQKKYFQNLIDTDLEIKSITSWLNKMPNLTEDSILAEQKNLIQFGGGFENWIKNDNDYYGRLDQVMIDELKKWAEKNQLMNVDSIKQKINKS